MKLLDRVEFTKDIPEQQIEKGMRGTIVDFNQDDDGIEAVVELDDKFIKDEEEDDPVRYVQDLTLLLPIK
jgi:hypothetical protein